MLKHVVLFKLKGSADERLKLGAKFKEALMPLPTIIEPLLMIEAGVNENPAEDWDIALTATLDSLSLLDEYAKHPAHLAAVAIIKEHIETRACVDYLV